MWSLLLLILFPLPNMNMCTCRITFMFFGRKRCDRCRKIDNQISYAVNRTVEACVESKSQLSQTQLGQQCVKNFGSAQQWPDPQSRKEKRFRFFVHEKTYVRQLSPKQNSLCPTSKSRQQVGALTHPQISSRDRWEPHTVRMECEKNNREGG